ncbi:hypothetical protein Ancab_007298 [Ancistrocladus abbreviatus]
MGDPVRAFANLQAPNEVSFDGKDGLAETQKLEEAMELFKMQRKEMCMDAVSFSGILNIVKSIELMERLECSCFEPDEIENHREALMPFREMKFRITKPHRTTLAIILGSCGGMGLLDFVKRV